MSLLDEILGQGGFTDPSQQVPTQVPMSPTSMPSAGPMGSPDQPAPVNNPDPMVVTGDGFHPVHRNLLGRIGDAILMANGRQPIYENRMRDRDLTAAMKGFDTDPIAAIKRVAKIPGMADDAYKMYEQYQTDQERDQSRNIRDAAKKDMLLTRLGGMAAATTEQNFPQMRQQMLRYLGVWGEKPEDWGVPDSYDKNWLDGISNGSISAKDQERLQQGQESLDVRKTGVTNLDKYRSARLGQMGQAEADRNQRFQANQDRLNNKGKTTVKMTKYGPATISPDGNHAMIVRGGKKYGYTIVNGTLVPVGELGK